MPTTMRTYNIRLTTCLHTDTAQNALQSFEFPTIQPCYKHVKYWSYNLKWLFRATNGQHVAVTHFLLTNFVSKHSALLFMNE